MEHVAIKPRTPRLNGKVERSHRTDKDEFYPLLTSLHTPIQKKGRPSLLGAVTTRKAKQWQRTNFDHGPVDWTPLDSRAEGEKTHMSEEARETPGVHNPHVIDLISLDPEANEVVLLMLEERPWGTVSNQLEQLDDKYNNYVSYVLDGHLAKQYPQYADKAVRIQLDCASPPGSREQVRINAMRNFAVSERLRFRMSVIVAQDPS